MVNLCTSRCLAKGGAVAGRTWVVWVSLGKSDPDASPEARSLLTEETAVQEVAAGLTKFSSVHL
jgi:hypothetical protein